MFLCRVAYTLHRVRGTYIYLRKDVYYVFVFDASKLRKLQNTIRNILKYNLL